MEKKLQGCLIAIGVVVVVIFLLLYIALWAMCNSYSIILVGAETRGSQRLTRAMRSHAALFSVTTAITPADSCHAGDRLSRDHCSGS